MKYASIILLLLLAASSIAYAYSDSDLLFMAVIVASLAAFFVMPQLFGPVLFGATFILASLFYIYGEADYAFKLSILSFAFLFTALVVIIIRYRKEHSL